MKVFIVQLLLLFVTALSFQKSIYAQEGGYVDKISVAKGDSIQFFISTSHSSFDLNVYKWGFSKTFVQVIPSITGGIQEVLDSSYWYGCRWRANHILEIPINWDPGVYIAEFPTSNGIRGVLFAIKERNLGSYSDIVVSLSVNTWQAYNNYGGKSLYAFNSTDRIPSYKVSYQRPFADKWGSGQYFNWGNKLLKWLEAQNIKCELTTSMDLYNNPAVLEHYKVLIIVGHDEYWSKEERSQIEKFVEKGGRIIILSGNTCYWQVRFEDKGKTMVCYRNASIDPLYRIADSVVTTEWSKPPVNYPENLITGVGFRNGGYVAYGMVLPRSLGYGDYAVYNSNHWIYKGTNLSDGDEFGWSNTIVGYEADGALFNWVNGFPVVTGADQSPLNYKILGISPAANLNGNLRGHATMGIYKYPNGGFVFNAATTDWVDGLTTDTIVQRITRNVIDRFITNRYPPEIVSWSPFRIISDSINYELVYLNRRDFVVLKGDSLYLTVNAVDPNNEIIKYLWLEGNSIVSRSSVYKYRNVDANSEKIKEIVLVKVFNNFDTTSISWNIYSIPLKIVSNPVTNVLVGSKYFYRIDILNYYRDSLYYELITAPSWLSISQKGEIVGEATGENGYYDIVVKVSNQKGDIDTQAFVLNVQNISKFNDDEVNAHMYNLLPNYPNPFNSGTIITYNVMISSEINLRVYNFLGQIIKTLISEKNVIPGTYTTVWSGDNDYGEMVSSGVYLFYFEAIPFDGIKPYTHFRKILLLR